MKMTIMTRGVDALFKRLEKNAEAAKKVLKATNADLKRRVPGKVADEVRSIYNIKKSEITPAGKSAAAAKKRKAGSVRIEGESVSDLSIVYRGRPLTPTHFSMTPKKPPARGGRKRRSRQITAEIKKGKRKSLGPKVFLGSTGGAGFIPFKRKAARRYPIEAVKTVSLPQMVSNETVSKRIGQDINELIESRLRHHMDRFIGH